MPTLTHGRVLFYIVIYIYSNTIHVFNKYPIFANLFDLSRMTQIELSDLGFFYETSLKTSFCFKKNHHFKSIQLL